MGRRERREGERQRGVQRIDRSERREGEGKVEGVGVRREGGEMKGETAEQKESDAES